MATLRLCVKTSATQQSNVYQLSKATLVKTNWMLDICVKWWDVGSKSFWQIGCVTVYTLEWKFGRNSLRRFKERKSNWIVGEIFRIIHGRHVGVRAKKDLDDEEVKFGEISKNSVTLNELAAMSNIEQRIMEIERTIIDAMETSNWICNQKSVSHNHNSNHRGFYRFDVEKQWSIESRTKRKLWTKEGAFSWMHFGSENTAQRGEQRVTCFDWIDGIFVFF